MTDGADDDRRPLLSVRNLTKHYPITEGILAREVGRVRAVDGVDLDVYPGETVGLVGESGCGKSTAARSIVGLEEPTGGTVVFDGEAVAEYDAAERDRFRRRVQLTFQDPDASFDPRMSVGESVAEPLVVQGMRDAARRREIVADLLERVGLSAAHADRYPHELSSGQKQRAGLARALSVNPDLLVADEPVSALDVSVQSEILALLDELQASLGLSVLLVSHDLAVVERICDRVAVMYLGEIVEVGPTDELFATPRHPYTRALLSAIPTPDPRDRGGSVELTGEVPTPSDPPSGCRFRTRCPEVIQPDGYEFEQETWRRVVDLRRRLAGEGVDVESIRERASASREATTGETSAALRQAFALPERLADPSADAVLERALEAVASGRQERARNLLADEFATPCETAAPAPVDAGTERGAACHRLESDAHRDRVAPAGPND